MRFLADENVPGCLVEAIVAVGMDVAWVSNLKPGLKDEDVLAWARREDRVLLTFDKDFGDLVRQARPPTSCGAVLFRLPVPATAEAAEAVASTIAGRIDWPGNFSVVEPGRIRMRRLVSG